MATATATDQGSTGVLVPLLASAANLVANDPDRPGGAEAITQIRETFTEFIGIIGEGEQMMVIQQDRSRRAAEWEDTEDCDLYTGTCLGSYRERSDGGGSVTRIAVWVRAFDKERLCDSAEDARELWRDHRSDPDAFDEDGVLYLSGIKSARAPFSGEMELDAPGRVIKAAKELQSHPVKMYRQLREYKLPNGKVRQVGVVHRIELNPDADEGTADDDVEETPAPAKRGGTRASGTRSSTKASGTRSSTKASGTRSSTKASGTRSSTRASGTRSSTKASGTRSSTKASGTGSRSRSATKPKPEPEADDDAADNDVPESKQAMVKWATDQGIKRGTLSRFLEDYSFDGGLPGINEDNLAEAYETIVEGIAEGKLGV